MSGTKLAKLLRLLSSDKPGEIVAAATAINRALQADGLDIHHLADVIERTPLAPGHQTPDTTQGGNDGWRSIRRWCADREHHLTPREALFISDLEYWRGQPTPRQLNWLLLLERKIRDRQAR